jgi:hypothetical protein
MFSAGFYTKVINGSKWELKIKNNQGKRHID